MKRKQRLAIVLAAIVTGLLLMAGCTIPTPTPTATPIPRTPTPTIPPTATPAGSLDFETVAKGDNYNSKMLEFNSTVGEAQIITVFGEDNVWQIEELMPDPDAIAAVQGVDFEQDFPGSSFFCGWWQGQSRKSK